MFISLTTYIPEKPKIVADIVMPTTLISATPVAPTSATPTALVSGSLGIFFLSFSFSHIFLSLYYEFIPSFLSIPHAIFHVPS